MKTKLTLNINSSVIEKAKKKASDKKQSLSAIIEEYLDKFSKNNTQKKDTKAEPSLIERIRKYTKHKNIPDDYDYKKIWHQHLEEKYGK